LSKIKHLFFDLDRTLWDFEANSKKALQQIFTEYKLENQIEHFNHFHHTYLRINKDLWQKYGKKKITKEELRDARFLKTLQYHEIHNQEFANQISQAYIDLSPKQTKLFPNAIETLTKLHEMGFKMHIITNGFVEVQYIKLKESKLEPFFDVIVCSEHIGFNKPDRRIFEHALNLACAKAEESMMIGDDLQVDILGANQVGMEAVLFDPEKKHKSQAFKIIRSLEEILVLLV
jgi:putative hydrolase of the HAD superfamily